MDIEELVHRIEEDIVLGVYAPGSRLIEDRMAKRFDVTRHALRSVFVRLGNRGFVEHTHNRGVEVVEPTPDEIDDLYQVREILETSAARMTPLPAPEGSTAALDDVQHAHDGAIAAGDYRAVFNLNIEFHRVQFSTCPNPKLSAAIEEFARKVHIVRAVKYDDAAHMASIASQHRGIVAALRGSDADVYVARVAAHLPASSVAYRRAYEIRHGILHRAEAEPRGTSRHGSAGGGAT